MSKLFSPAFIFLLVLSFLSGLGFYMTQPLLAKFAVGFGATLGLAGFVTGLFSITALFARPMSGALSDALNKKYIMLIATVVMALVSFLYTLATNVPALIVLRIVHGTAFALNGTASAAMVAGFIPKGRLGEGIGYYGLGQILSTAFGPNLAIFVSESFGIRASFTCAGIILSLAAVLMIFIPFKTKVNPSTNPSRKRAGSFGTTFSVKPRAREIFSIKKMIAPELIPLSIFGGLFSMANGIAASFLVLLGGERGISNIGLYFTVNALFLFLVRPLAGKASDRFPLWFIICPALLFTAFESIFLSGAQALVFVLIAAVCKAIGQGAGQPAIQSACLKKLGPEKSGLAMSTFYLGADIGQGFGPAAAGALAGAFGFKAMYLCTASIFLLAVPFFLFYQRKILNRHKKSETNIPL
ncbi:MAG: MFS transporter [Spirochaetaceae bacterium]|jgi:MFS family permease|nr:MFS transporter [Spirochaetaceae bacterium]